MNIVTTNDELNMNLLFKFADSNNFNLIVSKIDTIEQIISKIIIMKNTDLFASEQELIHDPDFYTYIPESLYSKFKLVFLGKIWKNIKLQLSDIQNLTNNSVVHCIFPILTNNDVKAIKDNIKISDTNINKVLTSGDFFNHLKNPLYYDFINKFINDPTIIQNLSNNLSSNSGGGASVAIESNNITNNNEFQNELEILANMGFSSNIYLYRNLLRQFNGNVTSVIDELLNS